MVLYLADKGIGGGPYRSSVLPEPWYPGDVREVPDDVGRVLLADFPGLFLPVEQPPAVMAPAPASAPNDRKMRSPRKSKT